MSFEITDINPLPNAALPTLRVSIRFFNNWSDILGGNLLVTVYANIEGRGRLIAVSSAVLPPVNVSLHADCSTTLQLSPDIVYLIDQKKSSQDDLSLGFEFTGLFLRKNEPPLVPANSLTAQERISASDWINFTSPWRKDTAFIFISPEAKQKLEELKRLFRFNTLEEVIDEAYESLKGKK